VSAGQRGLNLSAAEADVAVGLVPLPNSTKSEPPGVPSAPEASVGFARSDVAPVAPSAKNTGELVGWFGDEILARGLFERQSTLLGTITPIGEPFLVAVSIANGAVSNERVSNERVSNQRGVLAFGRDVSGRSGRSGLWLLRWPAANEVVTLELLVEGSTFAMAGARVGPLYVQGASRMVQPVSVGRAPVASSFPISGHLQGATRTGVVYDAQGLISWVAHEGPDASTSAPNVIGKGRVVDSAQHTVMWRTEGGEYVVTDVRTGGQWAPMPLGAARSATLNPFASIAAVIDGGAVVVWDLAGVAQRFSDVDSVDIVWLSAQQLLAIGPDHRGEILEVSLPQSRQTSATRGTTRQFIEPLPSAPLGLTWSTSLPS
jgi:hypothetical protein